MSDAVKVKLRVPQARVLAALMPNYPDDPPSEWPLLNRAVMAARAGYTGLSGTVTRALNGIREGSSSGDPQVGLIAGGLIDAVEIRVEGLMETNYRITSAGISAIQSYIAEGGKLPPVRDAATYTNNRYLAGTDSSQ